MLSQFYQTIFGCKTYKISLDAGCTCPNRDGTKGMGGCIFCSQNGSGDFASARNLTITEQIEQGKKLVEAKIRGRSGERQGKYIAYFQSFTSTYGGTKQLLAKYREALLCKDIAGLAIATRPDCLGEEILQGLAEISETHFIQIELGLQTSNEQTGMLINRCYTNQDYLDTVGRIKKASEKIHIVTHLIFGLPGETRGMMLHAADVISELPLTTVKFHQLQIFKDTKMADEYLANPADFHLFTLEDYIEFVIDFVERLSPNIVIERFAGEVPPRYLVSKPWLNLRYDQVLALIEKRLEERDTFQGKYYKK